MEAQTENLRTLGAGHAYGDLLETSASREALIALQRRNLAEEFRTALELGPTKLVRTPGWSDEFTRRPHATVSEVVYDEFANPDDKFLARLLTLLGRLSRGGDFEAQSIVRDMAAKYAVFHAGSEL